MKTLWLAAAFLMLGCTRGAEYSLNGIEYSVLFDEDVGEPVHKRLQPEDEIDHYDEVGGFLFDSSEDDLESSESSDSVESGPSTILQTDPEADFLDYLNSLETLDDEKEELNTRSAIQPGNYFHCYGSLIQSNLNEMQYLEGLPPIKGLHQAFCNSRSPPIPHDGSCGCYIGCSSGYPQLFQCREGYLYERLSRTCLPAREVRNCGGSVAPPRPPPRQIFPPVPKPTPFPEPDVVPSLRCPAPSGLFPHPTNCRLYLNCDRGMPHIQTCGPRTVFSKKLRVCVHPNKEDCDPAGQVNSELPWDRSPYIGS